MPWVKADLNSIRDNYMPLTSLDWQVHVYGEARPEMRDGCARRGLQLQVFPYDAEMRHAGLRRNAAYLLRPDGHVAIAEPDGKAAAVESYLDARRLASLR